MSFAIVATFIFINKLLNL